MLGTKELDLRNIYNPNLDDIQESAERTYGEANSFFRKEELYLKDIETRISNGELISEKDIYDECHAIASDLAKCCEMYLKALFIYENNIPGNQINELWEKLKNREFKTDEKGNLIYQTTNGIITFAKYDSNGEPELDENDKIIYVDDQGNTYSENNRGSKIKMSGHQLDRLIELLSPESRLFLESRMLTIPMDATEQNNSVSILDLLQKKGILDTQQQISREQYNGWIEQHKKTFEEARYSGEKKYDVNVEFLYHLTTQIKAVVQYRMDPKENQVFTVTDEELAKLPEEIRQLASLNSHLLSEELVKLIANNEEIKNKIISLISNKYVASTINTSSTDFCKMIKFMNINEISYILYLLYIIENYNKLDLEVIGEKAKEDTKKTLEIAKILSLLGITPSNIIGFFVQLKEIFGTNMIIENDSIEKLLRILRNEIVHNKYPKAQNNSYGNYTMNDYKNNNNLMYNINDKNQFINSYKYNKY